MGCLGAVIGVTFMIWGLVAFGTGVTNIGNAADSPAMVLATSAYAIVAGIAILVGGFFLTRFSLRSIGGSSGDVGCSNHCPETRWTNVGAVVKPCRNCGRQ